MYKNYETAVSFSTNGKFKEEKEETNEKQFKRYINQVQCLDLISNTL